MSDFQSNFINIKKLSYISCPILTSIKIFYCENKHKSEVFKYDVIVMFFIQMSIEKPF